MQRDTCLATNKEATIKHGECITILISYGFGHSHWQVVQNPAKPGKTGQTICKDPIQEIGFNHMLCRVILIKN